MVEPLVIASSCVSITAGLANLMMKIGVFVSEVKAARKDMDAVHRELSSLQLCLTALRNDEMSGKPSIPADLRDQVNQILVNIEMTINQINDMLIKLGSGKLGRRIQWAMSERDAMNKFRSSLESNKAALEIGLTAGTISMLVEQRSHIKKQNKGMAEMTQMISSLTVQSGDMSGKIDNVLTLQREQLGLTDIQTALDDLKTDIVALIKPAAVHTSLQNFSGQAMTHIETLLMPLDNEVGHVLDIPKATEGKQSFPVNSLGTCHRCKQDLSTLESLQAAQCYDGTQMVEALSTVNGLLAVADSNYERLEAEKKVADEKIAQLQEALVQQERIMKDPNTPANSPQELSMQNGSSGSGRSPGTGISVPNDTSRRNRGDVRQESVSRYIISLTEASSIPQPVVSSKIALSAGRQQVNSKAESRVPFVDFSDRKRSSILYLRIGSSSATQAPKKKGDLWPEYADFIPRRSGLVVDVQDSQWFSERGIVCEGQSFIIVRGAPILEVFPMLEITEMITLKELSDTVQRSLLNSPVAVLREVGAQMARKQFVIMLQGPDGTVACELEIRSDRNDGYIYLRGCPLSRVIDFNAYKTNCFDLEILPVSWRATKGS